MLNLHSPLRRPSGTVESLLLAVNVSAAGIGVASSVNKQCLALLQGLTVRRRGEKLQRWYLEIVTHVSMSQ